MGLKRAVIPGAADLAAELREHAGWPVELAHAGLVAKLKGSPDKSDFSDGRLLADLSRVGALLREHRARAPECDVDGRKIGRWSSAWVAWARTALALSDQARWIINEQLDQLPGYKARIDSVERRLREATAGDAKLAQLKAEAGVGEVTAWVLRAQIGRFDRFGTGKPKCVVVAAVANRWMRGLWHRHRDLAPTHD